MNELAQRLEAKRGNSTVALMAQALGIARPTYYRWIKGEAAPKTPDQVRAIADLLDVHPDEVYAMLNRIPHDIEAHLKGNHGALRRVRMMEFGE